MASVTLPTALHLNPWQQWQYFSAPRATAAWFHKRLGDLAPVQFQGGHYLIVLSPEGARQVFAADPDGYTPFWRDSFAGLHGEGSIWVLAGEAHRRERQIFTPALHARLVRTQAAIFREVTRQHMEKWQPGQSIRAVDVTLGISLDIIMRVVFGVEDGPTMDEGRAILARATHRTHPLIAFFPRLQRSWFPLWRTYAKARGRFNQWAQQELAKRRARGEPGEDVLGRLLVSRDGDGRPVTDEHICNELQSILAAGHNTTCVALAWAMYELSRHPAVVAKLRDELDGAGAEDDPSALLTLPYLSAVCNETVRLHTVVPECARVPTRPVEILGHTVPPQHALIVSIVGIHHDPALYPEPDEFRPERFVDRTYGTHEFLPFGGGHRRCLGAVLGEYELRAAVAEMVLSWDFEPAEPDYDVRQNLAMGPKHGVRMRLKRPRPQPRQPSSGTPLSRESYEPAGR